MAAIRYALEFGKRNNARLSFLFVSEPDSQAADPVSSDHISRGDASPSIRKKIEALIEEGKSMEGVQMDTHFRSGHFMEEVRQFVRDHYVTEIVVSLPDENEDTFEQTSKDIELLLKMTHCRILTVKPKK